MAIDFSAYALVLSRSAYRRFWIGFALSVVGDAMSRTALMWHVYATTGSTVAVGLLTFAFAAPIAVGGLVAGRLLDRFDRRRLLIADNLLRGAAFASIPLAALWGPVPLWHLYAVAAAFGALMMISLAGGPTLIAALVPAEERGTANALEMLGFTLGAAIGPALGGVLIARIGMPGVVALDALSYAAYALLLLSIRVGPVAGGGRAGERAGLAEAVRLLRGNAVLLATTLMFLAYNVGGGFLAVALPVLAAGPLRGGAGTYGALLAAMAAGQMASAVAAGAWRPKATLGALICRTQAAAGASLLLLAAAPSVPVAAVALGLYGAFSAPMTIWAQTLRMQIIPPALLGRSFALLRTIMQAGVPVGGAVAGPLLPVVGAPVVLGLACGLIVGPALAGNGVAALRLADRTRAPGDAPGH